MSNITIDSEPRYERKRDKESREKLVSRPYSDKEQKMIDKFIGESK